MRSRRWAGGLLLSVLLVACGDDGGGSGEGTTGIDPGEQSTGTPIIAPAVIATVDAASVCAAAAGATSVELQATRVGCVSPPPAPCTLPMEPRPVSGTAEPCPPNDSPVTLQVELSAAGRYFIEVVALSGIDDVTRSCWGVGGEAELLVTEEQIAAEEIIEVSDLGGGACG